MHKRLVALPGRQAAEHRRGGGREMVSIQNNGSSRGHSHGFSGGSVNLAINYVDVIVAQKD